MKGALCAYKAGVQKLNNKLFRSRAEPIPAKTTEDVARNLKVAARRLDALLDSAFRSGVQASLAIVKSWYPTVDLNLVRALRDDSDAAVGAVWTDIYQVAAELVNSVDLLEYTPYPYDARRTISLVELSHLQYTSSEDTEARTAHRDQGGSSRSRYLDDDDEDAEEEGEGSSAEHSETPVPPSTQPEATATSALGGVAHTTPAAPTSGDTTSAELITPASASTAPTTPTPPSPEATPAAAGPDAPTALAQRAFIFPAFEY